ncbi:MAG TPA: hypothetical protein VIX86_05380 [Streptosporangiaceae bacterium]
MFGTAISWLAGGLRPVAGWWRARGVVVRDSALAVVLAAVAFAPGVAGNGVLLLGELPQRRLDTLGVVLALGQCLPLAVRRRWPALCLVVVAGAFSGYQLLGYPPTVSSVGLVLALYSVGAYQGRFRRGLVAAATAGYAVLAIALDRRGSPERPLDYFRVPPSFRTADPYRIFTGKDGIT